MTATFRPPAPFAFPEGKRFAFTIFDDTDVGTLGSLRPLYDLLTELGLRTTKTVWPLGYGAPSDFTGTHTLAHADYSAYMRELAERGFEIAYHGPAMESSLRADAVRALDRFREVLGTAPRSFASHARNRDNLYWGDARFGSWITRRLYRTLSHEPAGLYQGHVEGSPYFWGDLSLRHLDYVRAFTFNDIDLWRVTPFVLYEDPATPWVRTWFSSNDADNVEEFIDLVSEPNQERLEAAGGICILSTHLGKGFVSKGRVEPRVETLLRKLAARDGWFVPVSPLLDHLRAAGQVRRINAWTRLRLELQWFADSLRRRSRRRSYIMSELEYLGTDAAG